MGPRLGIFMLNLDRYPSSRNDNNLKKDFYPSEPVISLQDWQYLMDYYIATSPDSMPGQQRQMAIQDYRSLKYRTQAEVL
jgi:hypothetical protein